MAQKKLPERAGLLRIQTTRLVSAHVTRFAALFHILPNLEGGVSIFCWSNNSRRPSCLLGIVLASPHLHHRTEKQMEANSQHAPNHFFLVSRWRNNPSFKFTHSDIPCSDPGGGSGSPTRSFWWRFCSPRMSANVLKHKNTAFKNQYRTLYFAEAAVPDAFEDDLLCRPSSRMFLLSAFGCVRSVCLEQTYRCGCV